MTNTTSAQSGVRVSLRTVGLLMAVVAAIGGLATTISGCSHPADGASRPDIVFFYMEDCYKCDRMKLVLEDLLAESPNLSVEYKEWYANKNLLIKLARQYGLGMTLNVPTIFVGSRAISGDGRAREILLREAVEICVETGCRSPLR